jgi:PTH1 family peptidyl-tRNA hydrolase
VKLIVGLGNPGKQYENTPHNAGFSVADELASRLECDYRRSLRFDARLARARYKEEDVLLVKPETYMNRSGLAVASIIKYKKAEIADLVVVLDDADLAQGRLRIRGGGSSGGHKGLASIIESVGSDAFARVRIGVGRQAGDDLVDHVLRPYPAADRKKMVEVFGLVSDAVMCMLDFGVSEAMNRFNGKEVQFDKRD